MTIEKFNYLSMLCEEQNVTKAANRLFITQPTLTAFINNLERRLGFKIFDRTHNPVLLTRSGKLYMEHMKKLLMEETELVDEIRRLERGNNTINIGIGQIHSEMWCPDVICELLKKRPELNVVIRESQEKNLMDFLRNDEIDVILGHVEIDTVNFHFETLCEENLVIAIPENLMPQELLANAESSGLSRCSENTPFTIQPEILSDIPIIQPMKLQGLFLNLKQFMDVYRIHPVQTIQTSNMITAATMVEMGLGYMYIDPKIFQLSHYKHPKKLYYCTLPRLARTRKFYIGYKRENPNLDIILQIKEILTQLV